MDYALSYEELGKLDYQMFVGATVDYPAYSHNFLMHILSRGSASTASFKAGKFQIFKTQEAYDIFEKLSQFEPYYEDYKTNSFGYMFEKLYRNENYNHNHLMNELRKDPGAATWHPDAMEYLRELETIYNGGLDAKHQMRFF